MRAPCRQQGGRVSANSVNMFKIDIEKYLRRARCTYAWILDNGKASLFVCHLVCILGRQSGKIR